MEDINLQRECSFCNNEWSISEGFNLETNQCKSCDDYDREEPIREAERERQRLWWDSNGKYIERYLAQNYVKRY